MELIICPTPGHVGRMAADKIAQVVKEAGPEAVLGVATGSSPLATYEAMGSAVQAGDLDLSRAWAFALDEYVGLPQEHPESYDEVISQTVTGPLGMDPARVFSPDGFAEDLLQAAARYEARIHEAGGVDVQILGIGSNGHIGFNEPGSSLGSRTRIKTLTPATRRDNSRFFDSLEQVPQHCLTQGLGTIMEARHIVLVAQGENKAAAVAALVEGPLTANCPASVLQWHQSVTVVVDEAAAGQVTNHRYHRDAFANKPSWQRFERTSR